MDASLIPQSNHGTMVEGVKVEVEEKHGLMFSSPSSSGDSSDSGGSSEFMDDATSSASSSSPPEAAKKGPLYNMSSLMAQLPFKRGLSKFYEGKSQSFACMANVRCLEDLAKPEKPCRKRLKTSMSCGGELDRQRSIPPRPCSRAIKKPSRGSHNTNSRKQNSNLGSRPPIPPKRTSSGPCHTFLFA